MPDARPLSAAAKCGTTRPCRFVERLTPFLGEDMVRRVELPISGVVLIAPTRFEDPRGYFTELYNARAFQSIGIDDVFVQDNMSLSLRTNTVRGLHFQLAPHAQSKLVRVNRGSIIDVAVDLRPSSPTYGQHVAAELSDENGMQIYIPNGFAHGFCTLQDNTEVTYKVSSHYAPGSEGGILWYDPELNIDWPIGKEDAIISEKDSRLPLLKELTLAT
jgi:dTDP-4-dehydrorhamnose 3,5-epimerase